MSRLNPAKKKPAAKAARGKASEREPEREERPKRGARDREETPKGVYRGGAIFAEFDRQDDEFEERRRKSEAGVLYVPEFWMEPGQEKELIFLDEDPQDGVAIWEHNLKINGKWGNHEMCCKEFGDCPLCEEGESAFVLKLSVIDATGYTRRKGKKAGQRVPHQKCMLSVKRSQIPALKKIWDDCIDAHGTMRGLRIRMQRTKEEKAPRIGEPVMIGRNKMYELLTETELKRQYGHPPVKTEDGKKVVRPANFDIAVYDYNTMYPQPDPEEMRKRFGGRAAAGSRAQNEESWGDDRKDERSNGDEREERRSRRATDARERTRSNAAADRGDPLASRPAAGSRRRQ